MLHITTYFYVYLATFCLEHLRTFNFFFIEIPDNLFSVFFVLLFTV